jgi:hypothetical protein
LAALPATDHPDADLIAWCQAFPAARVRCNAYHGDLDPGVPEWDDYIGLSDRIGETDPKAWEGWRAKALAAKAEATMRGGVEHPECTSSSEWAWDLMNDALRLGAGGGA